MGDPKDKQMTSYGKDTLIFRIQNYVNEKNNVCILLKTINLSFSVFPNEPPIFCYDQGWLYIVMQFSLLYSLDFLHVGECLVIGHSSHIKGYCTPKN